MNPYRYPYGYHPAPPPVDPGGVTPITTNQQGVAMMAPQGYISAAPSPAYPVYYGGAGAVPLGGSVPPVAAVPSTWGMHYGPGMAGVEYPAVTAMPGAYPTAGPVTTRELTQFPSPGSESVSTTYMPYASRGEFVSLASGNFGSPYVVPSPTSPPSVTRMSVGSVPSSSSEGVCPSTSSVDSASAHRSSLEDQEVRNQLRQFRHMLEGLERRLATACGIHHSPGSLLWPLQVSLHSHWLSRTLPCWSKPLRCLLNLLRSPQCSLLQPLPWDRLGNSAWLLPVVLLPLSHGVALQSPPWLLLRHGSPPRWCCPRVPRLWPCRGGHRSPWVGGSFQRAGWPQRLPRLRGESPCRARLLLRGHHLQHRLATQGHGSRCPTAIERLRILSSHGVLRLPRCTSTNSPLSPRLGLSSGQSPSLLLPPLPHQLRPWRQRGGSLAS